MKLRTAHVTNFRCVEDSTEFTLGRVTCLVGKNESGKTSILQALYGLHPWVADATVFDRDRDYPRRHLNEYADRHPDGEATVVRTVWELEPEDTAALVEVLGPAAESLATVTVYKEYGSQTKTWSADIDEKAVVAHVVAAASLHAEEAAELEPHTTITGLKAALEETGEGRSERHARLLENLATHFARGTAVRAVIDVLAPRLPKFLYFSQYQRMSGQVALEAVIQRKGSNTLTDEDRVFLAFCDLVGTPVEEIAKLNQFEAMIARFEAASNRITRELFRYWSQNSHLKVHFRLDAGKPGDPAPFNSGNVVRTRVFNTHHEVSVPFDDRSTGFVWFFSFLVLFSQVRKTHGERLVILLDEPALSLHAKAQADLLKYIDERLAPFQVVYTTHSPFMVPPHNLTAARTVEDVIVRKPGGEVEVYGTKVGDRVLSTDRDTLFPLQGALGYEITQSLFVGEHTLLVEGPSDVLYLKAFSEELKKRGRTPLDPRWVVCPVGGVRKVTAFMSLFGGNRLHVAVLLDFVSGDKKQVEDMRRSKLLLDGHVLTADHYAGQPEADVEDVVGAAAYAELVNKTYGLPTADKVAAPPAAARVVKHVEEHFRTVKADVPEFDHFAPAAHLLEKRTALFRSLPDVEPALDRFEKLFADLNGLIPPGGRARG